MRNLGMPEDAIENMLASIKESIVDSINGMDFTRLDD